MSRFLVLVLMSAWAGQATAADLRADLAQCRGIQSLAQRLQCYDRLVDSQPEINVTSTVVPKQAPKTTQTQPTPRDDQRSTASNKQPLTAQSAPVKTPALPANDKVKPEELFGKSDVEVKEVVSRELEIKSVDQISSRVTRIQISPSQEYVVYLENGQVWRQKNKAGKWRIKVGETAIISKAMLGSFLMKSDARKKSVRAERLK